MSEEARQEWLKLLLPAALMVTGYIWLVGFHDPQLQADRQRVIELRQELDNPGQVQAHRMQLREVKQQIEQLEDARQEVEAQMEALLDRFGDDPRRARHAQQLSALLKTHDLLLLEQSPADRFDDLALPGALADIRQRLRQQNDDDDGSRPTSAQRQASSGSGSRGSRSLAQRRATGGGGRVAIDRSHIYDRRDPDASSVDPRALDSAVMLTHPDEERPRVWRIEFLGRFPDVLAALQSMAGRSETGVVVGLTMEPENVSGPYQRWTLLVWI